MKFTAAFVTAAHSAAKANTAALTYRQRLSAAMKAAYAVAKAPAVKELDLRFRSAVQPVTYKQFCYLLSLEGISTSRGLANYSQMSKKLNSFEASAIIEKTLAGQRYHLVY